MKKIEFSQVAHLYLGCRMRVYDDPLSENPESDNCILSSITSSGDFLITSNDSNYIIEEEIGKYIPILRTIESLSESEIKKWMSIRYRLNGNESIDDSYEIIVTALIEEKLTSLSAYEFLYLLSISIDLFGLINYGEAIDENLL